MKYTKGQLWEMFARLPEPVQKMMYDVDIVKKIEEIGTKHRVHIDGLGTLAEEIGYVMVGANQAKDFPLAVAQRLQLPANQANVLAEEINREVFLPFRQELMKHTSRPGHIMTEKGGGMPQENTPRQPAEQIFNEKLSKLFRLPTQEDVRRATTRPDGTKDPYREQPE